MKERTRKIFIMIVMAALIVSLMAASFAALTYGRYSGGRRDENSAYEDILDLVGETAFEVSTADELVNAINNGYSYIKVVGDDPTLVVNNNVADVVVNLVLDVNGHKIVRNSRNPLLNVRQSVSVVLVYERRRRAASITPWAVPCRRAAVRSPSARASTKAARGRVLLLRRPIPLPRPSVRGQRARRRAIPSSRRDRSPSLRKSRAMSIYPPQTNQTHRTAI